MPFLEAIYIVFPVFAIIGSGLIFARYKRIDLGSIVEILLFLAIPAFIISSLLKKNIETQDILVVSLSAFGVVVGVGLMSHLYLLLTGRRELKGFYMPTMFMNSGNMAFPLMFFAFGEDAYPFAIVYFVTVGILVYTLGIYIAKGEGGWKEIFRLPLLFAALIGIFLNLSNIAVPAPIFNAIDLFGDAAIPLMLFSLGYRLYSVKISSYGIAATGAIIRIVGGVLIAFIVVFLTGASGLTQKVIILSSSMPSAVINFVITEKYNLQSDLVASIIFLSTLLSIFTIPAILSWVIR
ncbi:MAG: AEC family transporter [Thermodesulfobacteriota bacterium]